MTNARRCSRCGRRLPREDSDVCARCYMELGSLTRDVVGLRREASTSDAFEDSNETVELSLGIAVGDLVEIKYGPFQDLVGSVDELIVGTDQIRVVVSVSGRATLVDIEHWKVEKL